MPAEESDAEVREPERILLVDDNPTNLQVLRKTLDGRGYKLLLARSGEDALRIAERARPELILLDIMMPGIDGYETCRRLKADPELADTAVIFLSALDETKDKVRGLELGAADYVAKPFQAEEIIARVETHLTIQRLKRDLRRRNAELERELRVAEEHLEEARTRVDGPLIGESVAARALREAVAEQAAASTPLLLTGPVGAGQEATARTIHHESRRRRRPFIYVNCALLQSSQASAELASRSAPGSEVRQGPFDLATGGTLYLDGVHQLPRELQRQLVALLEEQAAGAESDVRLIATSSKDMDDMVRGGRYHSKLHETLAANQLRVPPLAERRADIPMLAEHFMKQHARRLGLVVERFSEASLERLQAYAWSGNVTELRNLVERAVVSAREPVVEVDRAMLGEGLPMGHYRLLEKLGEGGMGEVWRAKHELLARPAAVKLIRPESLEFGEGATAIERFHREARATAQLSSPNTVRLYDFGLSESGAFYYVMELLEGLDVMDLVENFGPLSPERTVMLLRQACRSLSEAHDAGLIHRDIKPANLFVCRQGPEHDFLKVLDFGMVKATHGGDPSLTAKGSVGGTPSCMPPEAILGGGTLDHRSDLYALGCVAWFALAKRFVFEGDAMSMLVAHAKLDPDPLSEVAPQPVPPRLEELVMACLEKDLERRPQSARELWLRLGEVEFERPWTQERAESWWREHMSDVTAGASGPETRDAEHTQERAVPEPRPDQSC